MIQRLLSRVHVGGLLWIFWIVGWVSLDGYFSEPAARSHSWAVGLRAWVFPTGESPPLSPSKKKKTERSPGKPRKKQQKEEGEQARRGDIRHQTFTYLDPLVLSTGMDRLPLPGADRG